MSERITNVFKDEIEFLMAENHIPGLAFGFRDTAGEEQFTCLGMTDSVSGSPIDKDTIFEVCSLTKPVFALYVLQFLYLKGLSLDTPVLSLLPAE